MSFGGSPKKIKQLCEEVGCVLVVDKKNCSLELCGGSTCTAATSPKPSILPQNKIYDETPSLFLIGQRIQMSKQFKPKTLHQAAFQGDVETTAELIKAGHKVNAEDERKSTPLHHAAFNGNKRVIKLLLFHGALIDYKDIDNSTPLQNAAFNGHKKTVRCLLDKGADVNNKDVDGNTALHKASFNGHSKVVELLLNSGADLDIADVEGATPLHKAISGNHIKCFSILLDRDANMHSLDSANASVLHKAAFLGNVRAVEVLLSKGARIDAQDREGYTPLHNAAYQGRAECVKALLDGGAAINAVSKYGCTALHYSVVNNHVSCVSVLLSRGAALDITEKKRGRTALHYAASRGYKECITLLLRAGADISVLDSKGKTALELSKRHNLDSLFDKTKNPPPKESSTGLANSTGLASVGSSGTVTAGATGTATLSPSQTSSAANTPTQTKQSVDRYGFVDVPSTLSFDTVDKRVETTRAMKWNKMMRKWEKFRRSTKLAERLYKGIPDCVRGEAWKLLTLSGNLRAANPGIYAQLIGRPSTFTEQINRDINRTFPKHIFFQERGGLGQQLLFNVLKAFSVYNAEVGYCQGMGFITATLLMYMEEEDAFWGLVRLCDAYGMSGLFKPGFPALSQCFTIFNSLLEGFLPSLAEHLQENGVNVDLYCPQWFLTLFIVTLPFALVLRVWDIFLYEGMVGIFLVAISLLKIYESKMLKMDFEELAAFLKFTNGEQKSLPLELDLNELLKLMQKYKQKPLIKQLEKEHPMLILSKEFV